MRARAGALCALVATAVLLRTSSVAQSDSSRDVARSRASFSDIATEAVTSLLDVFYAGQGRWRTCPLPACGTHNVDWGADSMTYTLFLRWQTTHETALQPIVAALIGTTQTYRNWCRDACKAYSDVPAWDAVAALREYEMSGGNPLALRHGLNALRFITASPAYASGACPSIRYQQPNGARDRVKTLETDATATKAALLAYRFTHAEAYLKEAVIRYAAIRRYYLDPNVPLYTVYVFDDGATCRQLPHRFFASVNGEMISNSLLLFRSTGDRRYFADAVATAHAVSGDLSDSHGVFANLQAENDIGEPLVEAMYELAAANSQAFAREWILRNASAAVSARRPDGTYGRFFDGMPPQGTPTVWQTSGGYALEVAAAALAPNRRPHSSAAWSGARHVMRSISQLPATLQFTGKGIALVGTIGDMCCQPGHARVFVDGKETFDRTGIWQNKSSSGQRLPDSVLFAWRWPFAGRHTLSFVDGKVNAKEGGSYLHVTGYWLN